MKISEDGFDVFRRGNVFGFFFENIAYLKKELKSEKDGYKRVVKYGVIKVVIKFKELIVLFTREVVLLYIFEKNRILKI